MNNRKKLFAIGLAVSACSTVAAPARAQLALGGRCSAGIVGAGLAPLDILTPSQLMDRNFDYPYVLTAPATVSLQRPRVHAQFSPTVVF